MFGKRPIGEIIGDIAKSAYALSPTNNRRIAPPILSGMFDIYANKDFKGDPIHPGETFGRKGVPASELKFGSTDQAWQDMTRHLAKAGGGNRIDAAKDMGHRMISATVAAPPPAATEPFAAVFC